MYVVSSTRFGYVMGSRYISSVGGDASRPLWLNLALVQLNMR